MCGWKGDCQVLHDPGSERPRWGPLIRVKPVPFFLTLTQLTSHGSLVEVMEDFAYEQSPNKWSLSSALSELGQKEEGSQRGDMSPCDIQWPWRNRMWEKDACMGRGERWGMSFDGHRDSTASSKETSRCPASRIPLLNSIGCSFHSKPSCLTLVHSLPKTVGLP